jgi:hypothetical protein
MYGWPFGQIKAIGMVVAMLLLAFLVWAIAVVVAYVVMGIGGID